MRNTHVRPDDRQRRRELLRATATAALGGCGSVLLGVPKAGLARGTGAPALDTHTNGIGMEFVPIPAGTSLMGSPDSDREARDPEKPQHEVTVSRPYHLGRFEVAQAQWAVVVGDSPFARDRSSPYYNLPGMAERITRPPCPGTTRRSSSPG